jgi:hypothetical protein
VANVAGTVEAILTMKDEMSPVIAEIEKNLPGMNQKFEEGQKVIDGWSEANQRAALKMERIHEEALAMNASMEGTNDAAAKTATTMGAAARGFDDVAKTMGVSTQASSQLAPALSLVEIGFTGLKTAAVGFNVATVSVIAAGLSLGYALGTLLEKIQFVRDGMDKLTGAEWNLTQLHKVESEQAKFQAEIAQKTAGVRLTQAQQLLATGTSLKQVAKDYADLTVEEKKSIGVTEEQIKSHEKAVKQADAHAEAIKRLREQFSGVGIVKEVRDFNTALGEGEVTPLVLKAANELATKATEAGVKVTGLVGTLQNLKQIMSTIPPTPRISGLATDIADASFEATRMADAVGHATIAQWEADEAAEEYARELDKEAQKFEEIQEAVYKVSDGLDALGSIFEAFGVSADSGVGKALGALKGLADTAGNVMGALAKGDTFGAVIAGVTGVAKAFTGLFGGNKIVMQTNDIRDAWFEAHGGFEQVGRDLEAVGLTGAEASAIVKELFDAKTPEEFATASEKALHALEDPAKAMEEATNKVREAMDKYGLTIEQMGPKFAQQELDKQALTLLEDYNLLIAAGAANNVVIEAMGPNINEYVNASRAAGTSIPKDMEPVIQSMIEQGLLLDENGNAFASVEDAGLSFSETLEESMTRAVDAMERLVNALLGIQHTAAQGVNIPVNYNVSAPPTPHAPSFAEGTGGFRDFGQGTLAMLHGSEAVMTPSQLTAVMMGAGSGSMSQSQLDTLTQAIIRGVRDGVLLTLR